jgi:hypothetical protein
MKKKVVESESVEQNDKAPSFNDDLTEKKGDDS